MTTTVGIGPCDCPLDVPLDLPLDDVHHYTCCDDAVALCGANLSDDPYAPFADDCPRVCTACRDRLDEPCGATNCPFGVAVVVDSVTNDEEKETP